MRERTRVSKEVFDTFINNYPLPLETNVIFFCEPPVKQWNDFSNGKTWPESVVASERLGEPNEYFLEQEF